MTFFKSQAHRIYVNLAQRRGEGVAKILSLFRFIDIWRAALKVVQAQLVKGKGTHLAGIGLFTFDVNGNPAFFPDPHVMRTFHLEPSRKPLKGTAQNKGIQFTSVDKAARKGAARRDVESVLSAVASTVVWALEHKVPSIMVQLGTLGDFVVGEGPGGDGPGAARLVGVRFDADFVKSITQTQHARAPPSLGLQLDRRRIKAETHGRLASIAGQHSLAMLRGGAPSPSSSDPRAAAARAGLGSRDGGGAGSGAIDARSAQLWLRTRLLARHGECVTRHLTHPQTNETCLLSSTTPSVRWVRDRARHTNPTPPIWNATDTRCATAGAFSRSWTTRTTARSRGRRWWRCSAAWASP